MNRIVRRALSRSASPLVWSALVLAGGLVGACSEIVNPDTSRLAPMRELDGGERTDATPSCPGGCDDGVACTVDACGAAGCTVTPDDAACGTGERCNAVMGCIPLRCSTDAECSDGSACTGEERCDPASSSDPSGCVAGTATLCDDAIPCTTDLCVDAAGGCVHMPSDAVCGDSIDCTVDVCDPTAGGRDDRGCVHTEDDARCDDGFCSTGGTCDASLGCSGGTPRVCPDDGDRCTAESCDAAAAMCISTPIADCSADTGETCATALPIAIDGSGRGRVNGMLSGFTDDYAFCTSSNGRDAVYFFDVTSLSDVVIETAGSSVDTVLAVALDCATAPTVCNDDRDPGASPSVTESRIFLHRVVPPIGSPSLRVYVFVDGYNASATGAFTLGVTIQPARADSCTAPMEITGGGTVLGIGPFVPGSGTYGSCQGFSDRSDGEGVLRMRPPADRDHQQIDVYSTTFVPEIYLRNGCTGTQLDCDIGSAIGGGINAAQVSTGTVSETSTQYLFVDGMGPSPTGTPHGYVVVYDP